MMAEDVARVAQRCIDVKESTSDFKQLDLSGCRLVKVPHALYLLMKDSPPNTCDLSDNGLTNIPAKFCQKFSYLEELRLCNNQLAALPDSLAGCESLHSLDMSGNQLSALPQAVYQLPQLRELRLAGNRISDLDTNRLRAMSSLRLLQVTDNPLTESTKSALQELNNIDVML